MSKYFSQKEFTNISLITFFHLSAIGGKMILNMLNFLQAIPYNVFIKNNIEFRNNICNKLVLT